MITNITNRETQLINFALGEKKFSLDLSYVHSILRAESVKLAEGDNGQIGWLSAKPQPIAVYSLAHRFQQEQHPLGPVIVLNDKEHRQAFMLEKMLGIVPKEEAKFHPLPKIFSQLSQKYFDGIVEIKGELLLKLDPFTIINNEIIIDDKISPSPSIAPLSDISLSNLWQHSKQQIFITTTGISLAEGRSLLLGLSITQICEVLELAKIDPVPCSSAEILGIISYRNRPITVIDIGYCLTGEQTILSRVNKLLIVQGLKIGELIAFPIGTKASIFHLPIRYSECKDSNLLNNRFVLAAFEIDNSTLVIPNVE